MRNLRRIAFVVVFVGLLYAGWRFAGGNETSVSVDYVVGRSAEVPLWKALSVAAATGVCVTFVMMILMVIRARLESRRFRKALVGLESEVEQLRPASEPARDRAGDGEPAAGASGRGAVQNV